MSNHLSVPCHILEAVDRVNEAQKQVLARKVLAHYGDGLKGKTLAVWGLAFKPRTDDIREAPALALLDALLAIGVRLRVHDPEAMANVKAVYGDKLVYCDRPYGALEGRTGWSSSPNGRSSATPTSRSCAACSSSTSSSTAATSTTPRSPPVTGSRIIRSAANQPPHSPRLAGGYGTNLARSL